MHLLQLGLLLASSMIGVTLATGRSGAAERVFAFAAYQMEEIMGPPYNIAPRCGEAWGVGRCTLNQFLLYLYTADEASGGPNAAAAAGNTDELGFHRYVDKYPSDVTYFVEPKNGRPGRSVTITQASLLQLIQTLAIPRINRIKDLDAQGNPKLDNDGKPIMKDQRFQVVDWVKYGRLYRGSTSYGDAMARAGDRVAAARTWVVNNPNDAKAGAMNQLISRAKEGITGSYEVRLWETDNHRPVNAVPGQDADSGKNRITWIQNRLSSGQAVVRKSAPNTQKLISVSNPSILDQAGMNKVIGGGHLAGILDDYFAASASRRDHRTTMQYVQLAQMSSGC